MDETQCLRMIRASLAPSTGCTEPAAIALNAATARKAAQGTVTQVTARLDAYLFKNAMGVGSKGIARLRESRNRRRRERIIY